MGRRRYVQFICDSDRRHVLAFFQKLPPCLVGSAPARNSAPIGTIKALVQGSGASINQAIELTAGAQDHGTLMRRYGIEAFLTAGGRGTRSVAAPGPVPRAA
jgi:hypothetical protein